MNSGSEETDLWASIARLLLNGNVDDVQRVLRSLTRLEDIHESDKRTIEIIARIILFDEVSKISSLIREQWHPDSCSAFEDLVPNLVLFISYAETRAGILDACSEGILKVLSAPKLPRSLLAECYYALGLCEYVDGNHAVSLDHFSRAGVHNDDPITSMYEAICKANLGRQDEAREQLEFLRQTVPDVFDEPLYHFTRGMLWKDPDSLDQALLLQSQRIDSCSKTNNMLSYLLTLNPPLLLGIASEYERMRRYGSAQRALQLILRTLPRHESANLLLSVVNPDEAKKILSRICPFSMRGSIRLARILDSEQNVEQALHVLEYSPGDIRQAGFYWLIRAKSFGNDFRSMIPLLNQGLSCESVDETDRAALRLMLGRAFVETNQLESGLSLLSMGQIPEEKIFFAEILIKLNRYIQALDLLDQMNSVEAIGLKLDIYRKQGKKSMYFKTLTKASGLVSWEFIGVKYLAIGEVEEALTFFAQMDDGEVKATRIVEALCLGHRYEEAMTMMKNFESMRSEYIALLVGLERFQEGLEVCSDGTQLISVVQTAWETTSDKVWIQRGITKAEKFQSNSELSYFLGEWWLIIGDSDSAFASFEDCVRNNPKADKALLALCRICIEKNIVENAGKYASRISDPELAKQANDLVDSRLQQVDVLPVSEGIVENLLLRDPRREYLGILGMYRFGRLDELTDKWSGSRLAEAVLVSLTSRDVDRLHQLVIKCAPEERDRIVTRMVHILLIEREEVGEAQKIMGEYSLGANAHEEFRMFRSLIENTSESLSSIPALFVETFRGRKSKNFKEGLKKLVLTRPETVQEFFLVEHAMHCLSDIRIQKRQWDKLVHVCTLWCELTTGNKSAWYRLGLGYLRKGLVGDAIDALERADMNDPTVLRILSEAYEKASSWLKLIDVLRNNPKLHPNTGDMIRKALIELRS
jgi:tetratricopeptide (TPR) repeat protein